MQQLRHPHPLDAKIVIIGTGIGGLSAAISLQSKGWPVIVYDKAEALTGLGAGIVLAPNAMKALRKLGAEEPIHQLGAAVRQADIYTWDGQRIVSMPTEEQARRYGTHSWLIHRSDLQAILLSRLAPGTLRLNHKLTSWSQDEHGVKAVFDNGHIEEGQLLIGADGLHSAVRKQLAEPPDPLRYAGYFALRGIAEADVSEYGLERGGGFEAWGPGRRFGVSAIGQGRVFWFAAINGPQGIALPPDKRIAAALTFFQGWMKPIEQLITATHESNILFHDIFDRKPLQRWSSGRVTLLGDAAHPMLPNLGQGGAQAMEDALALARCLESASEESASSGSAISAALQHFEQERRRRTAKIVQQSRMMARMVQLEHPLGIRLRNRVLRTLPARVQLKRLEWLVGYEP